MQTVTMHSGILSAACALLACSPVAFAADKGAIAPRTEPVFTDKAVNVEQEMWLSDQFRQEGAEVVWVKTIWGRNDDYSYNRWEQKPAWGNQSPWYLTFPRVAWFDGRMVASWIERNLPHGSGDAVVHVLVSDESCENWKTVAHFEFEGGINSTHFMPTTDGRLMLTGIGFAEGGGMMGAFSRDGIDWTSMQRFQSLDPQTPNIGQLFKIAWHDGKAYGLSRAGVPWTSFDGLNYKPLPIQSPADGDLGGNETASTFLGDQWIVFQRSGAITSSNPPYTDWEINDSNARGGHSHGGPDVITLPDGQVIAGSRGSGYPKLGEHRGGHMAVAFRYEDGKLTPLAGFMTGGTMTGYPSFTWHDGHLYIALLHDRPAVGAWSSSRGEFRLAKIKWPLRSQ